jgi:polyisoprenoid-binding protein YceI
MKNILTQKRVLVSTLLLLLSISAQADTTTTTTTTVAPVKTAAPSPGQVDYILDNTHSYVLFHINHFGFSNPSGKWMVDGTVALDKDKPQNSKVDVTIQLATLTTGVPLLDTHLKSKEFFDTDQYPTATFVSDKVTMEGKDKAKVHGILTLHGVSKPVTLAVTLNKIGTNPITEKETAGFSATAKLKRSDFDITNFLPSVGDDVVLDIQAEAGKATS